MPSIRRNSSLVHPSQIDDGAEPKHCRSHQVELASRDLKIKETKMKLKRLTLRALAGIICSVLALLPNNLFSQSPVAFAQSLTPTTAVVWQHVGRLYLDPNTGKAVYAGYLVHLYGINSSLFNDSPSESTAYFTFSTDVLSLTPMPNNGNMALSLVSAGTFNVYYNTNPSGDWNNPATFASGKLVATFTRSESVFPVIGAFGVHNLSESLLSSHSFTFNEQTLNFNRIAPHGITFSQFADMTPLAGIANYPVAFAAVGTTTAIGEKD
jgi:hypothetical protein